MAYQKSTRPGRLFPHPNPLSVCAASWSRCKDICTGICWYPLGPLRQGLATVRCFQGCPPGLALETWGGGSPSRQPARRPQRADMILLVGRPGWAGSAGPPGAG